MANKYGDLKEESVGAWAKRCYFAGRALMEDALRPYDLGSSQWYVLHQLAEEGPTMQRDLLRLLQVERATLSVIISSLVRKDLVEQIADTADQRQKRLRITAAGVQLWEQLPDLAFIRQAAFDGFDEADIATTIRVLRTATERLDALSRKENRP